MDYYDLVNEKDEVVGKVPIENIHNRGHIHRVVAVYVFAPDGKLYVQEHVKSGNKLDHSVGGHVDLGENYDTAAKREATEELGIVDPLSKLSVFYSDERFSGSNFIHYFGLYECKPSGWKFSPNNEVKNIFPMEIKEIVRAMNEEPTRFTAGFINTMREYLRLKKLPYKLYSPEKIKFNNSKGDELIGLLHNSDGDINKPILLFVHGHSSSKYTKNFVKLTEILGKKGIASFRIDLYGHGESGGKFEDCTVSEAVDDILHAIAWLNNRGYHKIGLLGSSFGGIASTIAASKTKGISFLVLKSPVSNYEEKYSEVNGEEFIKKWKTQGVREYDKEKGLKLKYSFYEDAIKYDGYKAASSIKVPVFIVHGDADEMVPVEQSIKISKILPNCQLKLISGSDHVYSNPNHRDTMLMLVSGYIVNAYFPKKEPE